MKIKVFEMSGNTIFSDFFPTVDRLIKYVKRRMGKILPRSAASIALFEFTRQKYSKNSTLELLSLDGEKVEIRVKKPGNSYRL